MNLPAGYRLYDSAEFLDDEEVIAEYLKATCEDGTPAEIAHALGVIARARNMTQLAEKACMSRNALLEALSGEGNPEAETIVKVADALGLEVTFVKKSDKQDAAE